MESKKGMVLPKSFVYLWMKSSDCECVKRFEILCEDYLKYYRIGNIIGKHVIASREDMMLAENFDFELFTRHYRDFHDCLGYVNQFDRCEYICVRCMGIYLIPVSYDMIDSFEIMETCYKEIQE